MSDCRSSDKPVSIGVPRESLLGQILFILFINNFHKAVEFSTVYHFADGTDLLLTKKSFEKLNKHINRDLKLVIQWIRANKLSKYREKKVISKSNRKITKHLNLRITGQKIVPVDSWDLGLTIQSDLRRKTHLTSLEKN